MDPDQNELVEQLGLANTRRRRHPLIRFILVCLALGLGASWVVARGGEPTDSQSYRTAAVMRDDLIVTINATGSLEPVNTVDVSTELSGTIDMVAADFNDQVKSGTVLAKLNTSKLSALAKVQEANLRSAKARLVKAEVNLEETRQEAERARTLKDRNVSSALKVLTADAAHKRAQADVEIALADVTREAANLVLTEEDLTKANLRSPIDGIVLSRKANPGQTVAASMSAPVLFTIAQSLEQMELQLAIDEADIGRLRESQNARFTVDAYSSQAFEAQVKTVRFEPDVVDNVVTYLAILEVENQALLLRPGMTATADIIVNELKDALLVPNAALRFVPENEQAAHTSSGGANGMLGFLLPSKSQAGRTRPTTNTIWVLRNGEPTQIFIEPGDTDGKRTEILSGKVKPGDLVILGRET